MIGITLITGCSPQEPNPELRAHFIAIDETQEKVNRRAQIGQPLLTEEVRAIIGEPTKILRVEELPEYFQNSFYYSFTEAEMEMQSLMADFQFAKQLDTCKIWRNCPGFTSCSVWLFVPPVEYPIEIRGLIPQKTDLIDIPYFLIDDGKAIRSGGFLKHIKPRSAE
jgi:hypothetical protein